MKSIQADYTEQIVIPPEDVIPKSTMFRYVKCSLVIALVMLILLAVIALIVAESFVKPNQKDALAIGVVSLVGIILFSLGLIAIVKEHIPLILTFAVSMIIYLLVFMYARVITSAGLIILRTFILLLLAVESFCFAIMVRDWKQIQISRLNQRLMKEAQYAAAINSSEMMMMPPPGGHLPGINLNNHPMIGPNNNSHNRNPNSNYGNSHPYGMTSMQAYNIQNENPYSQIEPSHTSNVYYTGTSAGPTARGYYGQ